MVAKKYEATDTFAYPRKDGITMPVVKGNVYELDLADVPKHLHDAFQLAEPEPPKKPARKPAK